MRQAKGFTLIEVVVIVVLLALVGGGVYVWQSKKMPTSSNLAAATPTSYPTPSAIATPGPTSNWKTYTSSHCGYSVSYPDYVQFDDMGSKPASCDTDWVKLNYHLTVNESNPDSGTYGKDGFSIQFAGYTHNKNQTLKDYLVVLSKEQGPNGFDATTIQPFMASSGMPGYSYKTGSYAFTFKNNSTRVMISYGGPNKTGVEQILKMLKAE